jgi:hypothetical protein
MTVVEMPKTAYLSNEDSPDIRNPIHSTAGGQQFGFQGPLVGGVTVYGWAAEVVIDALGDDWLDSGWAEMVFKRPIYPGENLTIRLGEDEGPGRLLEVAAEDSVRISGRVGLGTAPWFSELSVPYSLTPSVPLAIEPVPLSLASAPVGETLLPVPMDMDVDAARDYAVTKQRSGDSRFTSASPRLHPAMLAGYETMMIYGQFQFSPGIHVSSKVQHLNRTNAGPGYVALGSFISAFERKGRHHAIVDGSLIRDGVEFARARQELIFGFEPREK